MIFVINFDRARNSIPTCKPCHRCGNIRAWIRAYCVAGLLAVTNCLDSGGDKELQVVCCGVLVNMTSDESSREAFKNYGGVSKMISILRSSGERDWTLSALVCQTLWNVCSGSDSFPGDPMAVLDTLVRLTGTSMLNSRPVKNV